MADSVATLAAVDPKNLKITKVLDWSGRNRPRSQLNKVIPWWLTQHQTGNRLDSATAAMHMRFVTELGGGSDGVSFHLVVDDIEAFQLLTLSEAGYHASDGMEDWTNDVGGWGSIAMELCVNYDNVDNPARYLKAKQNAVALWVAVLTGDPRLDFGTGGPLRFNPDRLAPHNRWAWDRKNCPMQLMAEGNMDEWSGNGPFKDAVKYLFGGSAQVDPSTIYPAGMDEGIASMLFGKVKGDDGKNYGFNPTGQVSKKWLARGMATGEFPELVAVRKFEGADDSTDRTYFIFEGGWTLWRTGQGGIYELKL